METANWITLGIAGLTFLGTWLTVRAQQRRDRTDHASQVTASALTLIKPLEARIKNLSGRIASLEAELVEQKERRQEEVGELKGRVARLEAENVKLRNWIKLNTEFDPEHI